MVLYNARVRDKCNGSRTHSRVVQHGEPSSNANVCGNKRQGGSNKKRVGPIANA